MSKSKKWKILILGFVCGMIVPQILIKLGILGENPVATLLRYLFG